MEKVTFNKGYSKAEFYSIMGMFFAERQYKKEIPYLDNTPNKEWNLFYMNGSLIGFYAFEAKKEHTHISGFYVLSEFRNSGIGTDMVKDMQASFPTLRMVSNNETLLKILYSRGFIEISKRGSYSTVEWRKGDEIR